MQPSKLSASAKKELNLWIMATLGTVLSMVLGIFGVILLGYTFSQARSQYLLDKLNFKKIYYFLFIAIIICSLVVILTYILMIQDGSLFPNSSSPSSSL